MFIRLLIGALMIGSVYGLIALGYSIIYRASGLMNFAQGDLFMLGAFVGLTFYRYIGLPFVVSFFLTMIVMFLVGMLLERAVIRKILKKSQGYFIVLATIALSIFFKNLAMVIWGSRRVEFPSILSISNLKLGEISIQPESLMVVIVAWICMIILHIFMTKTKFGTAMRSAAQDPLAARACGIDVSLTTGVTWGLSSAVASVGGMLYGPVYGVSMTIGATIGQRAFSSAVVGGYGNMYGAIAGGLLIGFVETFAAGYISSDFKDFIAFAVLMLFLFLKPTGLFNERALQD
ncbi:branched-chain amino acid ABC transporter permease [Oscillospiraceae bacterium 38-13]